MAEHVDPADPVTGDPDGGGDALDNEPATSGVHEAAPRARVSRTVVAATLGVAAVVALASLAGWSTFRWQQQDREQSTRTEVLDAARLGATALTTIDAADIDTDVKTILEASTGKFRESFQERSVPFIDAVRKAQSKTEGTVTAAGIEKLDGDQAQVLVTVTVRTSNAGQPEQDPRSWRMRINVDSDAGKKKMSDVQFVP